MMLTSQFSVLSNLIIGVYKTKQGTKQQGTYRVQDSSQVQQLGAEAADSDWRALFYLIMAVYNW